MAGMRQTQRLQQFLHINQPGLFLLDGGRRSQTDTASDGRHKQMRTMVGAVTTCRRNQGRRGDGGRRLQCWSQAGVEVQIATEEEVKERASYWEQTTSDYTDLAERYLGFQQPGSVYGFSNAGDGCRRPSVLSVDPDITQANIWVEERKTKDGEHDVDELKGKLPKIESLSQTRSREH